MKSILRNLVDFNKSPVLNFFKRKPKVKEFEIISKPDNVAVISFSEEEIRIVDAVKILVVGWDSKDTDNSLSGEYKRHQVYAKLMKIFPKADKKRLGLFIELVINECV